MPTLNHAIEKTFGLYELSKQIDRVWKGALSIKFSLQKEVCFFIEVQVSGKREDHFLSALAIDKLSLRRAEKGRVRYTLPPYLLLSLGKNRKRIKY